MKRGILFLMIFGAIFTSFQGFSQWVFMDSVANQVRYLSSSSRYLYACSSLDGIFYSADSGYTWIQSNNGLTHLNVRCVAAKDSIVIAATEGGVFRSSNYGINWIESDNGIWSSDISTIYIKGDSILIGSYGGGISLSIDFGWNYYSINNGLTDLYVNCLYSVGSRLFAGTEAGGGIFVSDDNGATWTPKNYGVPIDPWAPSKYDIILAFTNSGPTIFASTWDCGMLKSDDNGETWNQEIIGNNSVFNFINTLANYDWDVFAGCNGTGIYKTVDDGMNWLACNDSLTDWEIQTIYVYPPYLYAGTTNGRVFRRLLSQLVVGIQPKNKLGTINVNPNPVTGISELKIPEGYKGQNSLSIYAMDGSLRQELKPTNASSFYIPKTDFEPGLYCYILKNNGVIISQGKFIVM